MRPSVVRRGFTLIEMLLVISIIVLLMALLVPQIGAVVRAVTVRSAAQRVYRLHNAVEDYHRVYADYPPSESDPTPYNQSAPQWDYPRYCYPNGDEATNLFSHDKWHHAFGGRYLVYFLFGPQGRGWHRPQNPRNTSDPDYPNRFISAEWDAPEGLSEFLENSPVDQGDFTGFPFPCFVDGFDVTGRSGGVIAYARANLRKGGDAKWEYWNMAMRTAYYEDCYRDESSAGTGVDGQAHMFQAFHQSPYDFVIMSPGPNGKFGYHVYGTKSGKKRWFANLAAGITDDIANFPLR